MKLKEQIAEMEARRASFTSMLNDPNLSEEDRAVWRERLDELLAMQAVIAADMAADPDGYRAWLWADDNNALLEKARRFPQ